MADDETPRAWERRPDETVKSYAAFLAYADLPPKGRSVAAAYRAANGRESDAEAPGYWRDWAQKNDWEGRAAARDRHVAAEALDALVDERKTLARQTVSIARLAQAKAVEGLQGADSSKMSAGESVRVLEVAHKLLREIWPELVEATAVAAEDGPQDDLGRLRERLMRAALAGDVKAADTLVRLEERLARAAGTDAPVALDVEAVVRLAIERAAAQGPGKEPSERAE